MSEQDYASKDLKRRPFRTSLIFASLTTVVAATTFLLLFGNALLDVTSIITSGGISGAFAIFFETFIWATLLLALSLGVVVVSSTISLEVVTRRKDIGLMKSIGTLMDTIFDHFMAQALILLGTSVIVGIAAGAIVYMLGLAWLASRVPTLSFSFDFPWLQVLAYAAIYLVIGFYAAQKPIYDTVHESPIAALNPEIGSKVRRAGYLDTFGLPFRIATKGTGRRFRGSGRTLLSLFLSISLASILWIGGGIVESTTDAYIIRSMGSDVVAIGDPGLLGQYYAAYSLNGGELLDESFDYLNSSYMVPSNLIGNVTELPGVKTVDLRLLSYANIREGPGIIWNPTFNQYESIGQGRQGTALIVGLDWDSTVSNWFFDGQEVSSDLDVWIGGQIAATMYDDPLVQKLEVSGSSLNVSAVAFDILNGGAVAFMDLELMQVLLGASGANLVLVQLERYDSTTIARIESFAQEYGFGIYLQQDLLEENLETIGAFWLLLQPLPIMALLSAFLSLMNYLLVSVFGRLRDYIIMKSIGAKPSFIVKVMIAEGTDIGMKSGIPAVFVATLFSIYFLIPEAAVPSLLYLPVSMVTTLVALLIVVILAAVPVYLLFQSKSELRVTEFSV
ncbi:MAG: FtsX-like permease family protein [Promethearchaeota archaeon]